MQAGVAYDSFSNSEHDVIKNFNASRVNELDAESSGLLDSLAWTHFHYSVLEHINLTYLIKGTSRGVLQEHAVSKFLYLHKRFITKYKSVEITTSQLLLLTDMSTICPQTTEYYQYLVELHNNKGLT